jgi:hypothetical protein
MPAAPEGASQRPSRNSHAVRPRPDLARTIEQWEHHLIDADIVLNDAAADLDRAVAAHQVARRQRHRVAEHLRLLRELTAEWDHERAAG